MVIIDWLHFAKDGSSMWLSRLALNSVALGRVSCSMCVTRYVLLPSSSRPHPLDVVATAAACCLCRQRRKIPARARADEPIQLDTQFQRHLPSAEECFHDGLLFGARGVRQLSGSRGCLLAWGSISPDNSYTRALTLLFAHVWARFCHC